MVRLPIVVLLGAALAAQGSAALAQDAKPPPRAPAGDAVHAPLLDLMSPNPMTRSAASETLKQLGPRSAIPTLIELLRYRTPDKELVIRTLETISGQSYQSDWEAWVSWLGRTELEPHPGYVAIKSWLLSFIDPRFAEFIYPGVAHTIRLEEVIWGGVKVEGIPALEQPPMIGAEEALYMLAREQVFGLFLGGEARAYPYRVIDWHELFNDVVGGVPVTTAYCTLCGAAVAFDPRVGDTTYSFATSGLLYRSNKLMFDRQTKSLWSALEGKPVIGTLVGSGAQLTVLPSTTTTWGRWKREHPATKVLSLQTGHQREYRPGAAYGKYQSSPDPMFPVPRIDPALPAKDRVYAVRLGAAVRAYPVYELEQLGVVQDRLGEVDLVLVAPGEGEEVRAYRGTVAGLGFTERRKELRDGEGRLWIATDTELAPADGGAALPRVPGHLAYWFGWHAQYPGAELWRAERAGS
ncbi:MAG TPA: DUF3179 domain-containing protein [Acidobacteriota bacterium]